MAPPPWLVWLTVDVWFSSFFWGLNFEHKFAISSGAAHVVMPLTWLLSWLGMMTGTGMLRPPQRPTACGQATLPFLLRVWTAMNCTTDFHVNRHSWTMEATGKTHLFCSRTFESQEKTNWRHKSHRPVTPVRLRSAPQAAVCARIGLVESPELMVDFWMC